MWLTLLAPIELAPLRSEGNGSIVRQAKWLRDIQTCMNTNDKIQFLSFLMHFLSNQGRSGSLFIGSAISIPHFAQVCAQRAWRGILVSDHPFGSENWRYVHSAISNALPDNKQDRLLVYLYDVMSLLIPGDAPYEKSSKLAYEMIIQNIKVSQT